MRHKIGLVIPAYNEEKTIGRTLTSVYKQDLRGKFELEVVVVVNGSKDQSYNNALKFSKNTALVKTRVINSKLPGKGKALNLGLKYLTASYAGYMDADIVLGKGTIYKTYSQLVDTDKNLKVVGALNIPLYHFLEKDTLLYQIQRTQQIHREERRRVIPCGAYITFSREVLDRFPENIHSEDTWLGLHCAKMYGWGAVKVMQDAKVYFTPPTNWLDYIKQQARFERGYYQLIENFPELESTWDKRRDNFKGQKSKKEINSSIIRRLEKEKIPKRRLQDLWKIVDEIFVETCDQLEEELVNSKGRWEPIVSTKKI